MPGPLDAFHQLRRDGIGHGGDQDGNILDHVRGRLGRGRRDGQDQVHPVRLKLSGDGLRGRQVPLGALNVVDDVDAFRVAQLSHAINKPLPGLVERGMLDDLGDPHFDRRRMGHEGKHEER